MDLQQFLQSFGLTETESTLYLALLSHPHRNVSELAADTGLNRTRLYHALATLQEKGLVREIGSTRVKRYAAEPPEQLASLLKRKELEITSLEKKLQKALPQFPNKETGVPGSVSTEYFYGKEGILNLAEKVFASKTKIIYALNPPFKTMEPLIDSEYGVYYLQVRANKNIETKTIWQDKPSDALPKKIIEHKALKREMRIAPIDRFGEFKTSIQIFDNSVAIISYLPELFGVLISSPAHAETMRLMWQQIWQQADIPD